MGRNSNCCDPPGRAFAADDSCHVRLGSALTGVIMSNPIPFSPVDTPAVARLQGCLREAQTLPGVDAATCHWLD
jgi:hypothetical protein